MVAKWREEARALLRLAGLFTGTSATRLDYERMASSLNARADALEGTQVQEEARVTDTQFNFLAKALRCTHRDTQLETDGTKLCKVCGARGTWVPGVLVPPFQVQSRPRIETESCGIRCSEDGRQRHCLHAEGAGTVCCWCGGRGPVGEDVDGDHGPHVPGAR